MIQCAVCALIHHVGILDQVVFSIIEYVPALDRDLLPRLLNVVHTERLITLRSRTDDDPALCQVVNIGKVRIHSKGERTIVFLVDSRI